MMAAPAPRHGASLGVVYATVFIDLLGFGIILPALPYYADRLGAGGLWLGMVLTAYSLAQLLGAAILGRLSDRFGRRPVILLSLAGSSVSMALTGIAPSLTALVAARALAGLFGGSIAAAQAYIADVTRPEERSRFLGYLGAATGMGFVLGPALGALLIRWGFAATAFAAAALAAAALLLALVRLQESLPPEARSGSLRRAALADLRNAWARRGLRPVLAATFLTGFAFVGMETTLAYLGKRRFGLDERGLGLLLVLVGVVVVGIQGGLIGRLTKRFGDRRPAIWGAGLMAVALAVLPLCASFGAAAAVLSLLAAGRALSAPTLTALLSRLSSTSEQGGALGLGQSLAAGARTVGPLATGWLFDLGPARPYMLTAVLAVVAATVLAGGRLTAEARSSRS
jgi:DHA1 family tetracycline resistance protein-like MFS transporter